LKDSQNKTKQLDNDLKEICRVNYEFNNSAKDEKIELEHQISDLKYSNSKLKSDLDDLNRKYDESNNLYTETYKYNEKILREFDDFKRHQISNVHTKNSEISGLKSETNYAESKIKEASNRIQYLERQINSQDEEFIKTKEKLTYDINLQLEKYSNLKHAFDDIIIELKINNEKYKESLMNGDENKNKLHYTEESGYRNITNLKDENSKMYKHYEDLTKESRELYHQISIVESDKNRLLSELNTLKHKHDFTSESTQQQINKLEKDNYNLLKIKEELEKENFSRAADIRNQSYDFK